MPTAITADALFTPEVRISHPVVLVEEGVIVSVASRQEKSIPGSAARLDFPGAILAPGFLDIHIHGGGGHDVMDASPSDLAAMERGLAQHGVTAYLPTTVTASLDATLTAAQRLGRAIRERRPGDEPRARPLGLHLEGPFLSHARRGVHPAQHLLEPSVDVFDRLREAAQDTVALMTMAPELPGASELIAHAARHGVRVSLGHSDASLDQARGGIAAGAGHVTHTFNAMRALHHRDPGLLAAVLGDDRLTADIIADGIHVDPAVVALFLKLKGPERAVLITDALSATGMPDGSYRLGGFEFEVRDGHCTHNGVLAGSVLTMELAVRNAARFADWPLHHSVRLATLNPARVIGAEQRKGRLAEGADADIVVLTPQGEVVETLVGGRAVSGAHSGAGGR